MFAMEPDVCGETDTPFNSWIQKAEEPLAQR